MAQVRPVVPVKLFCGILVDGGRHDVLNGVRSELCHQFGEIDFASDPVAFDFTDYYRDEMGDGLLRYFFSFRELMDPGELPAVKLWTNALELRYAVERDGRSRRRVNLDPGYITPAKLVLATTKDFSHRLYLGHGIYAEVTLSFSREGVQSHAWTYRDYSSGAYDAFFLDVRRSVQDAQADGREDAV